MDKATISQLRPGAPAIGVCARWRHDAFFKNQGFSVEDCVRQLVEFVELAEREQAEEIALLADVGGTPAGTCLLARREIDPAHDLTPWLAGLFVAPAFRKQSIGSALVAAIEGHGRKAGCRRLHLYTNSAEAFYARLGWLVSERFHWHGAPFVLMHKALLTRRSV